MKKFLLITSIAFVLLLGIGGYQYFHFYDGRLHVIFCDVGQGDAILIISPSRKHILVDGGPDTSVLDCLGRHLPFWERKIELMLLTHPHADHFNGLAFVIDRFVTMSFATERLINKTGGFSALLALLEDKKIPQRYVFTSDQWQLGDGVVVTISGPSEEFLERTDLDGIIDNSAESAALITEVSYGEVSLLLTGDAPVEELLEVARERGSPVEVLQSPHHGSKTGINREVLELLAPQLSVISVGKDNTYGHPTKSVLDLYQQFEIPVLRTDQVGDVEIVSDGEKWWVNK
ncbi:MAG: MBL fold metallo-hydrolase [Patescibacteria group bacterium]